jgi:hypothetical protein
MLAYGRPGGANIRALIEEFALTNIDIQETGTSGTNFTCCPSTKVRILTPEELRARHRHNILQERGGQRGSRSTLLPALLALLALLALYQLY